MAKYLILRSKKKLQRCYWSTASKKSASSDFEIGEIVKDNAGVLKEHVAELFDGLALHELRGHRLAHSFCGPRCMNYWWSTPYAEKNYINSEEITILTRLAALRFLREMRGLELVSLHGGFSPEVEAAIRAIFCCKTKYFKQEKIIRGWFFSVRNLLATAIYSSSTFLSLRLKESRRKKFNGNKNEDSPKLVIITFLDRITPSRNAIGFVSDHWVGLDEILSETLNNFDIKFVHLKWRVKDIKTATAIVDQCNVMTCSDRVFHELLESNISLGLFLQSVLIFLKIWLKNLCQFSKILEFYEKSDFHRASLGFVWRDLCSSLFGAGLFAGILWHKMFACLFNKTEKCCLVIFFQENIFWERGMVSEARQRNIPVMGATLSPIGFWDLRYHNHPNVSVLKSKFEPDVCLVNGPEALKLLRAGNFSATNFRKSEAIRYPRPAFLSARRSNFASGGKLNSVLVIGSLSHVDTSEMFAAILGSKKFEKLDITYRPHPGCSFQPPKGIAVSANHSVFQASTKFEYLAVSAATNACLDVFLISKKPLLFRFSETLEYGPLFGRDVPFFYDAESLRILREKLDKEDSHCIEFDDFFYWSKNRRLWQRELSKALV